MFHGVDDYIWSIGLLLIAGFSFWFTSIGDDEISERDRP